jgi:BCD family chlorophyll transporter-like MFS transporter
MTPSLGWLGIVRLGLVQAAIGSIVVLTTSTLNRVMVVELALVATLPAALVGWHYVLQLSRPVWGYGSDVGGRRTPWIIAGMGLLSLGGLLATDATILMSASPGLGFFLALVAFAMIGAGVGAAGTSLLALLTVSVAPERRPAAASITWVMMIFGIVFTAAVSGQLLDPYSPQRLALVASGIAGGAFLLTILALGRMERKLAAARGGSLGEAAPTDTPAEGEAQGFFAAMGQIWREPLARTFTIFVFVSMVAYSAQDLILEPFAGLVFGYTLGQSTALSGVQHGGVLLGMVLVGLLGALVRGDKAGWLRRGTLFGCLASASALATLAFLAAYGGPETLWALQPAVFSLGFANGFFAVCAIGMMMSYAAMGKESREGTRLGVWGAAQAVAFAIGGLVGAMSLDLTRTVVETTQSAFVVVFVIEAVLFVVAGTIAVRLTGKLASTPGLRPMGPMRAGAA